MGIRGHWQSDNPQITTKSTLLPNCARTVEGRFFCALFEWWKGYVRAVFDHIPAAWKVKKPLDIAWYPWIYTGQKITRESGITRLKIRYPSSVLCHPNSSINPTSTKQSSRPSGRRCAGMNRAKSGKESSNIPLSFFWSFLGQAMLVKWAGTISENCLNEDEWPCPLTEQKNFLHFLGNGSWKMGNRENPCGTRGNGDFNNICNFPENRKNRE